MALARSGLYMNWIGVTVTPQGGSALNIDGVTALAPGRMSRQEVFYGDARTFARMIKCVEKKRTITIASGNIAALASIPDDTPCTINATLLDPRNGAAAGGGAITVTLVNAVLEKDESQGPNNKYAGGTAVFNAYGSVDDSGNEADPMAINFV